MRTHPRPVLDSGKSVKAMGTAASARAALANAGCSGRRPLPTRCARDILASMIRLTVLLLGLLGLFAHSADAVPITCSYSGTVDSVGAYDPAFISDPINATFSGEFTFDSTAPDLVASSVNGS